MADGIIVGSAIVKSLAIGNGALNAVRGQVSALTKAINPSLISVVSSPVSPIIIACNIAKEYCTTCHDCYNPNFKRDTDKIH